MRRRIIAGIVIGGALVVPGAAFAQEAASAATVAASSTTTWEIGGKASFLSPPIRGGTNPFGPGFGGRLGVSFGGLYVGASVVDYLGGQDVDLSAHAIMYGGELGYGITKSLGGGAGLTLRPSVSAGGLSVMYTTPTSSATTTTSTRTSAGTASTQVEVQPVDVITTASASRSSGSSSSGLFGSDSTEATTTVTAFYVQPGATLMLASSWGFIALKGSMTVVPAISDGLTGTATWLVWGGDGEIGLRF